MRPEVEKRGLLPPRPITDGVNSSNDRRPADIFLPRGSRLAKHMPEAVDFAVSSGMRRDRIRKQDGIVEEVFTEYTSLQESHMDTAAQCKQQGLSFLPFIIEGHGGGWSAKARRLVDKVGRAMACRDLELKGRGPLTLAQRLSCVVHREGARAILRRLHSDETDRTAIGGRDAGHQNTLWEYGTEVEVTLRHDLVSGQGNPTGADAPLAGPGAEATVWMPGG